MKALLCKEYGPADSLVVEEVPAPPLGKGEVRIGVRACGVNYPDNLIIAGKYQVQPPLPFSPGFELAGEILEVADGITHLRAGQRVAATSMGGAMAEEICVPATNAVPIPDSMEFTSAAGFIITYGTSYHALRQRAQMQPAEKLLVLGAGGGVGRKSSRRPARPTSSSSLQAAAPRILLTTRKAGCSTRFANTTSARGLM
jgi:NADPH2:quinone reductase